MILLALFTHKKLSEKHGVDEKNGTAPSGCPYVADTSLPSTPSTSITSSSVTPATLTSSITPSAESAPIATKPDFTSSEGAILEPVGDGSDIVLYLPANYDCDFMPVKAERLRPWFEEDQKAQNHAKFCLPLLMGSGLGYYILSPAKFTVHWNGDRNSPAEIEIHEAASHSEITNHSTQGGFTVQAQFIATTNVPGDFIYVKGVANQYRKPYSVLEACIEAWWNVANFGIVALCNQPGSFTIELGEPIAQMFVVRASSQGDLIAKYEMPREHAQWLKKRSRPDYSGKDLDYLKGLYPDGRAVDLHYRSWRGKVVKPERPVSIPPVHKRTPPPSENPPIRPERMVFHTIAGDLVYRLFADIAPETVTQFLHLVRSGVYDTTHFNRVEPGFLIQSSTAEDRLLPLPKHARAAIHPIRGEFTTRIKHRRGILSMARWEDRPDSAETSYSILLNDAPHLDGKFAIFGFVEHGFEVLDEMLRAPRDGNRPRFPLLVISAEIIEASDFDERQLQPARRIC